MSEFKSNSEFEKNVSASFGVPAVRPEFVNQVYANLMQQADEKSRKSHRFLGLRPAWAVASAILGILIISVFVIGPQRVYASFLKLFGYIPGVGIVNQSSPIRVLAEPVSITREDIIITVTSATLTGDRTQIEYRIFGVPQSAYPDRGDVIGCYPQEYLRLADGTLLTAVNYGYQPVPADINEAVFVIPCIPNTLPGRAPENWELPLQFVPAPADMVVMPVTELLPLPSLQVDIAQNSPAADAPVSPDDHVVMVSKVVDTTDGYILVGSFQPQVQPGETFQQVGALEIQDASGKEIAYTYPLDVNELINEEPNGSGWGAQIKATGLDYPLTISFLGVEIYPADPNATAEFSFDAGTNPQQGQVWELNQEIQLAGHTLKLVSITADSRGGYSFSFEVDPKVYSVGVQISGTTPIGVGGGGGINRIGDVNKFSVVISYEQRPTGVLTVRLSNLTLIGESITWEGQWSPETVRTDLVANPQLPAQVCLTPESLAQLQAAPAALTNGKVLLYEKLETGAWGLVVHELDGSQKQIVAQQGTWGALSPDGSQVAYPAADDHHHIFDLALQTEQVLPGLSGYDLHWSPDGKQIAYLGIGAGSVNSVNVINIDSHEVMQISTLSQQTIIGWSPDGLLYFAAPYTGSAAWKVFTYEFSSGTQQERFTIENGTPKFLNPSLSPDGNWIAYRGADNSSVYLVHPDGSDMHLILDNVSAVGIEWSSQGWLGVSLRKPTSDQSTVALINPDSCEAYLLPIVSEGDLEGLFIE
ncbi:MAG: hypothetical protein GX603_05295 [Chloroflexi bacterium]|nr:hypothetical protein [Chloroflexota bacterium]